MKFIFCYSVLLFFALSCKKSNDPCADHFTPKHYSSISPSLNPYRFKKDTYWVYQNDATAQIDSQRVVFALKSEIGSGVGSSCNSYSRGIYEMSVQSTFNNQYFQYKMMGEYISKHTYTPVEHEEYIYSNTVSSTPQEGMKLLETMPTLNLNGNSFQDVKKIRVDLVHDIIYYFADGVGVVKWEVMSGSSTISESWSIKSWQVIL